MSICNTYCFSTTTTTTVTRTLLDITLHVRYPSLTESLYSPDLQTDVNDVGQNRRLMDVKICNVSTIYSLVKG